MQENKKRYIGIDLGGTFIKGGIVTEDGEILVQDKVPTECKVSNQRVVDNIAKLCQTLMDKIGCDKESIVGIGLGSPGMIDGEKGVLVISRNLGFDHFPMAKAIEEKVGLPVKMANDANVAALGETKFGMGKKYKSTLFLTLGTGVGGGIIIDGKLFEGNRSAGAELGHVVIIAGGEPCTCGRKGCLEAYASATALIRETKREMQRNPQSKMWAVGSLDNVDGKTAFDYKDVDEGAKAVVDNYIEKLGVGIVNFVNELRPEAVLLGGGVCAQGDNLIVPLQDMLNREIYGGSYGPQVPILVASLGNSAGLLGAAALWL